MSISLFQPITVGNLDLSNRIFMAPLTRMRASQPGDVPNALMAEYYTQRAGAGQDCGEEQVFHFHRCFF